ncbi:tyrosine-type recombinase/integrase [Xanthomonas massiliensis]|uniref:tyrosine-type recombinase/integrase n=1 Tax=Xanthomonas massiliensis TaxID=1720302 RepID=UPI000826C397|nr:integrase arm-type DNA-binding domain-containing protein [Xanthomonas massiliensis]
MARTIEKALTDLALRKAKPGDKPLRDGGGLYALPGPNGRHGWRLDYRVHNTRKTISLGVYPDVSLTEARKRREEARQMVAAGIDPSENRKAEKAAGAERAANSFEVIAREWLASQKAGWTDSHHAKQVARLENHAFPWIGKKPIAEVGVADLRPLLDKMAKAEHNEQAHRVMAAVASVFKYAVATGRAERNPAADLSAALPPRRKRSFPTITDPKAIGGLLRAIDGYQGTATTIAALKLAPLTFVRPGELRGARWKEVELDHADGPRWVIPPERRKLRKDAKENPTTEPHVVPLSRQAAAILHELQPLTGNREFVFPGVRDPKRPMSENTINAALRNIGYDGDTIVGHGFRHMASTLLNEQGFNPDAIERQLAHKGQGVRAIYNLAKFMPERRKMMQAWADYLDGLRADTSSTVVPFKPKAA